MTLAAAKELGLSDKAAEILAEGAVDADKRDWNTSAAHGQSKNDELGRLIECPEQAQVAFLTDVTQSRFGLYA